MAGPAGQEAPSTWSSSGPPSLLGQGSLSPQQPPPITKPTFPQPGSTAGWVTHLSAPHPQQAPSSYSWALSFTTSLPMGVPASPSCPSPPHQHKRGALSLNYPLPPFPKGPPQQAPPSLPTGFLSWYPGSLAFQVSALFLTDRCYMPQSSSSPPLVTPTTAPHTHRVVLSLSLLFRTFTLSPTCLCKLLYYHVSAWHHLSSPSSRPSRPPQQEAFLPPSSVQK